MLAQGAYAQDPLKTAIAHPQRTPANVERDAARHPYETLSFFGVNSKMTVVELAPRWWLVHRDTGPATS